MVHSPTRHLRCQPLNPGCHRAAGMPVVTTTVLAIGAQEMVKEKAIVSR